MTEKSKKRVATLLDKMVARLMKTGVNERKAKELAKALVPTVRGAVKAEQAEKSVPKTEAKADTPKVSKLKRPKLGQTVEEDGTGPRTDLPVVSVNGGKNVTPLQIIKGLTSGNSYIAAAIKGEDGIIAVRKVYDDSFKVKFYPDRPFWNLTEDEVVSIGLKDHLHRNIYDRYFSNKEVLDQLLLRVESMKPKRTKMQKFMDRFKVIVSERVVSALEALGYGWAPAYQSSPSGQSQYAQQ